MRLCAPISFRGNPIIYLFSTEHDACMAAQRSGLNHKELLPLLIASRNAESQLAQWSSVWGDPIC